MNFFLLILIPISIIVLTFATIIILFYKRLSEYKKLNSEQYNKIIEQSNKIIEQSYRIENLEYKTSAQDQEIIAKSQEIERITNNSGKESSRLIIDEVSEKIMSSFDNFHKSLQFVLQNDVSHKMNLYIEKLSQTERIINSNIAEITKQTSNIGTLKEEMNILTSLLKGCAKNAGNFGELILIRILTLMGLKENQDFFKEKEFESLRPDVVILLGSNVNEYSKLIVDSKSICSIEQLSDSDTTHIKETYKNHIKDLQKKRYTKINGSLDFMVMFIPSENIFNILCDQLPDLIEDCYRSNIIVATPSTICLIVRLSLIISNSYLKNAAVEKSLKIVQRFQDEAVSLLDDFSRTFKAFHECGKYIDSLHKKLNNIIREKSKVLECSGIIPKKPEILEKFDSITLQEV